MKRKMSLFLSVLVLCTLTSACTSKLTTIRPTLISRIAVYNAVTSETAEIIRDTTDDLDWLMDDIVFQMEQMYEKEGKCNETDGHLYKIEFYMNDKLELDVYINSDGSVCKKDNRYLQVQKEGNTHPIDPEFYDKLVDLH